MTKPPIATACSLVLLCLALLAGCGGSSTSGGSSAERKTACTAALAANNSYKETLAKLGLNIQNKLEVARAVAATSDYRSSVEALERSTSQTEKGQLAQLASALARNEKVLTEFGSKLNAAAAKDAQGLNPELDAGEANLKKICSKS